MESTLPAHDPTFAERFRAAWRGEESLAWAFWSVFILCGFALWFLQFSTKLLLLSFVGTDLAGFEDTPAGQVHLVIFEGAGVTHVAVSFILMVRCLTNVSRKSWEYLALGYLFALPTGIVDDLQKIIDVFAGQ